MDKDKEFLNKYQGSLNIMAMKEKEFGEVKLRLHKEIDLGNLKISQLKIEMRENHLRVNK